MSLKIAVITPIHKNDYLTDLIIDGLSRLVECGQDIIFKAPGGYNGKVDITDNILTEEEFINFASGADLILFCWGKDNTNLDLACKINRFNQTVFLDGSEVGGNRRLDSQIQRQLLTGIYQGNGRVDNKLLEKCALYFKREKPYLPGVKPFPFGIESRYIAYSPEIKKDLDFVCVFGQEDYPPLRRYVRETLEDFCQKNNFICHTSKTDSQAEFYKLLARAKVGISVGGGGYDTARFWEILGNNCMLLTETIDIYEPGSDRLKFDRIWQFNNLFDFQYQLEKISKHLREKYEQAELEKEYEEILKHHSAWARVEEILTAARDKGIIT